MPCDVVALALKPSGRLNEKAHVDGLDIADEGLALFAGPDLPSPKKSYLSEYFLPNRSPQNASVS